MATPLLLLQKLGSTAGNCRAAAAPSRAWKRTFSTACSLSSKTISDRHYKVPPLGDDEASEFPLPPTSYPVMMIPFTSSCQLFSPVTRKFTNLTYPDNKFSGSTTYPAFSTSHGWIAYYSYKDGSMFLANPLSKYPSSESGSETFTLPPFHTLPNLQSLPFDPKNPIIEVFCDRCVPPGTERLFCFKASKEIPARQRGFKGSTKGEEMKLSPKMMRPELCRGNLALSSSPTEENCMALYFPGHYLRRDLGLDLAFCRVGDTRWTSVTTSPEDKKHPRPILGLVYSKKDKLFYALTHCGRIEAFDLNDSSPSSSSLRRFDPAPRIMGDVYKLGRGVFGESLTTCWRYFVESPEGEPLLVIWCEDETKCEEDTEEEEDEDEDEDGDEDGDEDEDEDEASEAKTIGFLVYKLNFSKKKNRVVLEEFNLEGTALFVSKHSSFCLPVRDHPGLMPNSVYFYGLTQIGMYNLLDRALTHFYEPFQIEMDDLVSHPMWVAKPQ
ncbi:hypothetical protein Tsubulata_049438 [Turnera subulata]|uniref:KIB1-4 beta-propeller domain-containing protein n=1 Tax=Turnera subulata TaxID=218843 RepID=A0A9Q0J0H2_9ROSI|nr:hypothetical protein Tsubulata_049438 [Turnera subulata]